MNDMEKSDIVTIKLPVSGSEVELRNYTTEEDDERANQLLYMGVTASQLIKEGEPVAEQNVDFPIANVVASEKSYVPRLVRSINGDSSNLLLKIKSLRTEDYAALKSAVDKIVEAHSPKVKKAARGKSDLSREI